MKKDAISTGLFIAIGFLCVAIVIAILVPVVRDVVNDADDNRPDIPGVSVTMIQPHEHEQLNADAALLYSAV
ncbi:hypothetical protein R70723_05910 [Paenibacillus sp. FSL R7-0273]|uniref:hypothetical protein n=1 Tax=Paenibacillus sp. FSL R7-0273 TaxID=1536772 RepID=UPI0004F5DEA9|nr:hypothetical protein [Paenibacillus sp. FSL R7-0273]AIQ45482.1 hypothetical protein R70723_05910 [Paenibacillus sp. FSL R7-0273]OMF89145.1 hypothetical protein BK144_20270 [Paenibacillus sp. FSL R7-0273]